tara:strand:- start:80 stop:676 length:597 start_codon:yes stop_codon:yes gene_type:complete
MPNDTFSSLDEGSCGLTHVDLFSTSVHLPFLECKRSAWLIIIIFIVIGVKLGQNFLYTKMGQLQREILQLPKSERGCCSSRIWELLGWEFLAGVIGIVSVLVITGNNAIIWATIILANMGGTALAFTQMEADHHSTALELMNMLEKYPSRRTKKLDEESQKTYDAMRKLREVLRRSAEDERFVRDDFEDETENTRLIL